MTNRMNFLNGVPKPRLPLHLIGVLGAFASLGIAGITLAAPSPAQITTANDKIIGPTHLDVTMDARLGGLKFGSISMKAAFDEDSYSASSVVRTEGITDHVFRQVFDLKAQGQRQTDVMQTASYQARNTDQDNIQLIDVTYGDTGTPLVAADPPYDNSDRVTAHAHQLKGTIDPLSAMIVPRADATPDACDRKIPVYDGRRRYDFVMTFEDMSELESDSGYSGPAVRCNAWLVPISGYKRQTIRDMRRDPMAISVWLAPVAGANALVPARIEVATPLGTLVARSTEFAVSHGIPSQAAASGAAFSAQ